MLPIPSPGRHQYHASSIGKYMCFWIFCYVLPCHTIIHDFNKRWLPRALRVSTKINYNNPTPVAQRHYLLELDVVCLFAVIAGM